MSETKQERLAALRERCDQMGIKYTNFMNADKLAAMIEEKMSNTTSEEKSLSTEPSMTSERVKTTDDLIKEATREVRCVVINNNPDRQDWKGEIFTAQNAVVPKISKYVPFGETWHVPVIILNMIKERQYRKSITYKEDGRTVKTQKWLPEFTVNELPPISEEEFNAIRDRQLAQKKAGE